MSARMCTCATLENNITAGFDRGGNVAAMALWRMERWDAEEAAGGEPSSFRHSNMTRELASGGVCSLYPTKDNCVTRNGFHRVSSAQ